MMPRHRSGFTLLEVMVVIAIIAIMVSVLVPAFAYVRYASRRNACSANLILIGKALVMYAENPANGMFPSNAVGKNPRDGDAMPSLNKLFQDYVPDPKIFSCPAKPLSSNELQSITAFPPGGDMFSSYGYDPGHRTFNAKAAVAADKIGALGINSDNHGPNAGQNVLIVAGTVEFRPMPVMFLGNNQQDDSIYTDDTERISPELDGHIRD